MIKDNQKTFNRLHVIMDGVLIIFAYIIAYELRFGVLTHLDFFKVGPQESYYQLSAVVKYLLVLVPGYLILYSECGLYKPKRGNGRRMELWNLFKANTLGLAFFALALYLARDFDLSRKFLPVFFICNIAFDFIFRSVVDSILKAGRKKGFNLKHVLVVGYSRAAEGYIDRIMANPQWGYYIHGILDDNMAVGTIYKKVKVIGAVEALPGFLEEYTLDEIVITLSIEEYSKLKKIVGICEKSGVHTKFIPDYNDVIPTVPTFEDLDGLAAINIRNVPLSGVFNRFVKRAVDIAGALTALLLFGIPMAVVAIIIKKTSPGPVIFSQNRIGLHNCEFKMYKFRSMEVQPQVREQKAWTVANDPRVTKIGRFIRKTSIDELPQLFNVLKGDMSLVGPRPERPFFVEKFKEEIPRYMIKHQVRPGMTGWAQVNGYRGDTSIRRRIEHDLYYIENWTLGFDFKILFLTFFRGFVNRNAY